jgi:outer membrane lipoprotein-sorting protein
MQVALMSKRIFVVTALIVMLSCAAGDVAIAAPATQPSPAANTPEFEQQLRDINAKSLQIKDLTADFVQEKQSPLLRKPLVSRGTVAAKGDMSRWDTTAPEPTRMTCDPHLLRLYYPNRKIAEEYPVASRLGMLAASPLPSLDIIRQNFTLAPDDSEGLPAPAGAASVQAVRMDPANNDIRKYVDHARVLLDTERGLVYAFEMIDPDGERTLIRFSNIKTDTGLTDSAVKLDLPADVKIVRPLGDGGAKP